MSDPNNPETSQPAADAYENTDRDESGLRPISGQSMGQGAQWIGEGFRLWRRSPLALTAIGIMASIILGGLNLVPGAIGGLASMVLWPVLSAGIFLAYRHAFQERPVLFKDLFPGQHIGSLIGLGSFYTALSLAMIMVVFGMMVNQIGMEQLQEWMDQEVQPEELPLAEIFSQIVSALLVGLVLSVLLFMAFAFAPILVHQHSKPVFRAIGLSFMACLRNIPAFLIWSLCWFGLLIAVSLITLIPVLGAMVYVVFLLALITFVTGSLYAAYLDIFIR